MLERKSLWLGPWQPGATRLIRDPATREQLGIVRKRTPARPWWAPWFDQTVVDIFETEDESHVFSIAQRLISSAFEVTDSENRSVGLVRKGTVQDAHGQLVGVLKLPDHHGQGQVAAAQGQELAVLAHLEDGLDLTFSELLDGNPFARMLVLAGLIMAGPGCP